MEEAIEHRERLKILEKHIGKYYYMTGNIHNGISDAMEEYHQYKLKLLGIADVVGRSEQLPCPKCGNYGTIDNKDGTVSTCPCHY